LRGELKLSLLSPAFLKASLGVGAVVDAGRQLPEDDSPAVRASRVVLVCEDLHLGAAAGTGDEVDPQVDHAWERS